MTTLAEQQLTTSVITDLSQHARNSGQAAVQQIILDRPIPYHEQDEPVPNMFGGETELWAKLVIPSTLRDVGRGVGFMVVRHVAPDKEASVFEVVGKTGFAQLGSCALGSNLVIGRGHDLAREFDRFAPKMPYGYHPVSDRHVSLFAPSGKDELRITSQSPNGTSVESAPPVAAYQTITIRAGATKTERQQSQWLRKS